MALARGQRWHLWPATRLGVVAVALMSVAAVALLARAAWVGDEPTVGVLLALASAVLATTAVTRLGDRSRLLVVAAALGFWLSLPYLIGTLLGFE